MKILIYFMALLCLISLAEVFSVKGHSATRNPFSTIAEQEP